MNPLLAHLVWSLGLFVVSCHPHENFTNQFVKSTTLTGINGVQDFSSQDTLSKKRLARSLDSTERNAMLDIHNDLRRREQSSDMELMVWNVELESMALEWSQGCDWGHGQPPRPQGTVPWSYVGQNLYATTGTFSAVGGIQLWYDEVEYYNYDSGHCSKEPCGHYTQMVWAASAEVGCAYTYCSVLDSVSFDKATYLVCNYGPGGNIRGRKPYTRGPACTKCGRGQNWCNDGLCTKSCANQGANCECAAQCHNCGKVVKSNCSCACANGWTGPDCSDKCEDKHTNCGANPGWPARWCDKDYVLSSCPLLCGLCNATVGEVCISGCEPLWNMSTVTAVLLIAMTAAITLNELH